MASLDKKSPDKELPELNFISKEPSIESNLSTVRELKKFVLFLMNGTKQKYIFPPNPQTFQVLKFIKYTFRLV